MIDFIVGVDIGHGAGDSGAFDSKIGKEKDINLIVGLELRRLLFNANIPHCFTRINDLVNPSLTERANIINNAKCTVAISIHHNAGGGVGYDIIHSIFHGEGKVFADMLAIEFKALGQKAHGVGAYDKQSEKGHYDYYAIIRQPHCPSIISEYAFMDSVDRERIDTVEELLAEANAIFKAILRYRKHILPESSPANV